MEVKLPDGRTALFPDDMSREAIEAVLQREFPPTGQDSPAMDAALKTVTPFNRALAGTVGLPGDIANLAAVGVNAVAGTKLPTDYFAGSDYFRRKMEGMGVKFKEAESPAGKVAQQTVQGGAEAALTLPLGLVKGATLAAKARDIAPLAQAGKQVVREAAPAVVAGMGAGAGQEVAGQVSNDNPLWRLAGGIAGGMGAARWLSPKVAAREAVDTAGLPQAVQEEVARLVSEGIDPQAALAAAKARSLPVPVNLTRGQSSLGESGLRFEQNARQGTFGQAPADMMAGHAAKQQQALTDNVGAIQTQIGGGKVAQRGQAGTDVQDALLAMKTKSKAVVDSKYAAARDAGVAIAPEAAQPLPGALRESVADFHPTSAPQTYAILKDMEGEVGQLAQAGGPVPFATIEARRRQLGNLARDGGAEGAAARKAIKALDDGVDALPDDFFSSTADGGTQAWKDARAAAREHKGRFEGGDLTHQLTAKDWRGEMLQTKVAPDQAENVLFGSGTALGGKNTARDLSALKTVVGEQSDEWAKIREAAWLRLAGQASSRGVGGEAVTSGQKGITGWDKAIKGNKAVIDALFTPDELATMKQYFETAARVTARPDYSTAASSANAIVTSLKALGNVPLVKSVAGNAIGLAGAARATNGLPRAQAMSTGTKAQSIGVPSLIDLLDQKERK